MGKVKPLCSSSGLWYLAAESLDKVPGGEGGDQKTLEWILWIKNDKHGQISSREVITHLILFLLLKKYKNILGCFHFTTMLNNSQQDIRLMAPASYGSFHGNFGISIDWKFSSALQLTFKKSDHMKTIRSTHTLTLALFNLTEFLFVK